MEKKVNTNGTVLAFATYKAKPGHESELTELIQKHFPVLRKLEFATDRTNYIARAEDGTFIEVFEWSSSNAIAAAHQHPAVCEIWEKMSLIADFTPMKDLPDSDKPFPGFAII